MSDIETLLSEHDRLESELADVKAQIAERGRTIRDKISSIIDGEARKPIVASKPRNGERPSTREGGEGASASPCDAAGSQASLSEPDLDLPAFLKRGDPDCIVKAIPSTSSIRTDVIAN